MPMRRSRIKIGTRLGTNLTVLGVVDDHGQEPVYLVWHHKRWCPMACKVFKSAKDARREAKILQTLAHPNIVRSLGMDGPTRLLMEYLEGPSLHDLLNDRPKRRLGIHDALRLSIHIGGALCHIHERGLVHLDVKPANIIVVKGRPVLCDFGIARWLRGERRPRGVIGTEGYIAPEECLREKITPAADIFGLGVTLYELLTGKLPFPDSDNKKNYPQVSQAPASLRRHRRGVPIGLEKLILSCLNRDPKARPNLEALLLSLHGFITSGPPMWPKGFQRRNRTKHQ